MNYSANLDIVRPDFENLQNFVESCFSFPALVEMLEMARKQRNELDPVQLEILRKAAAWLFAEFKSPGQEKIHAETMSQLIEAIQPDMRTVLSDPLARILLAGHQPPPRNTQGKKLLK